MVEPGRTQIRDCREPPWCPADHSRSPSATGHFQTKASPRRGAPSGLPRPQQLPHADDGRESTAAIREIVRKYKRRLLGLVLLYVAISLWLLFVTDSPQSVPFEYQLR